ncbi:hypothetical protein LOTGIDRAFT_230888 [Lottia gigantea]|uniref:Uncharacterized protein n=1 Tax=Lottia gigantea TaxID=225164 RepID=V4B146_LOTGI|nr:hypothetical protein LOTGIDRAFT_230888 [Lottia gigantea]ESO99966.1 hypothetical protein LOTGIDRAFT_230888 [Lottia gigantea]
MGTELRFPLLESTETGDDVILIAPWRMYVSRPSKLSESLGDGLKQGQKSEINCMMDSGPPDYQLSGQLDQFCDMWVIECENNNDIDICLEKLQLKYSLLHVNLVERKVFKESIEIPMLIFINNKSEAIEKLKNNLNMVKEAGNNGKHFSYEIDYGPAVEKWASDVLKRDFVCIGGRFCITNSDSFNHVLDWNNILGCLVCLPCGLMAGSAYRIGRKSRYMEKIRTPKQDVVLVGANGRDGDSQRKTLLKLINWASKTKADPLREETEFTDILNRPSTSKLTIVDTDSNFKGYEDPLQNPDFHKYLTARLCIKCIFKQHKEHETLDVECDETRNKAIEKLQRSQNIIQNRIKNLEKTRATLLKSFEQLQSLCEDTCAIVTKSTEENVSILRKSCKQIITDIKKNLEENRRKVKDREKETVSEIDAVNVI